MIQNILILVIIIAWSLVIFLPEYIQNKKLKAFNSKIIRLTSEPIVRYNFDEGAPGTYVSVNCYFENIKVSVTHKHAIKFKRLESYEYEVTFINGKSYTEKDLTEETKAHLRNFLNLPKE